MITRDTVQGFIDGLKAAGSDLSNLGATVEEWLKNHHTYPVDEETAKRIVTDLGSYKR
jgi:hypothetical protein